jgi:hypothetical protein
MSDNEKALALILCSGAMIVMCNMIKKEKKRRRWWRTELYRKRVDNELIRDLKFQHVSGHYKNFTRMSPTDFDKLLTMIGPKISKKDTRFRFFLNSLCLWGPTRH